MAEKAAYRVACFKHSLGITSGCVECNTIHRKGQWAVGIIVSETHKYLVGVNPPITCCGEEREIVDVRDTKEGAETLATAVSDQLNREGSTKNLKLYGAHQTLSSLML